jgi:hypothetical protein
LDYIVFSAAGTVTLMPIVSGAMESMVVPGVSKEWTKVTLSQQYLSPIAVCTVEYNTGNNLLPALVRMKEVLSGSFKIRLQNPSDATLGDGRDVHCVVVEEGAWEMPDGRKIEAKKYLSTLTDYPRDTWVGEAQTYTNSYTNPVVLGQVMSYNDPDWSVFWSRGSNRFNAPSGSTLFTGKHIGEDVDTTRDPETVGYIVVETGHATSNGIEIETKRGLDIATGYVQGEGKTYTFDTAFSTTPAVAVLSQATMAGGDGSWAVLAEVTSKTSMLVAVDEDQIADVERNHKKPDVLDYIVFSAAGTVTLMSVAADV